MASQRGFVLVLLMWVFASSGFASESVVATPAPITTADLPETYPWYPKILLEDWVPLEFSVDLDRLAPLGTVEGNGAEWFADFSKHIGERHAEWEEARAGAIEWEHQGRVRKILPPDHALLLEAEPWIDRARWSFYPEMYTWQGGATPIPNLLFALQLGRNWIYRGMAADTPEAALADYRRSIRLGRLLMQDDTIYIQNLIGIALVRYGAEAIYDHARTSGDAATAAFAALVLQDCIVLRHELIRRFERLHGVQGFFSRVHDEDGNSRTEIRLPDARFHDLIGTATKDPCAALRLESAVPLRVIAELGTAEQRSTAKQTLNALTTDPDPMVAAAAKHAADQPFDPDELEVRWTGSVSN